MIKKDFMLIKFRFLNFPHQQKMSLEEVIKFTSENAAKRFGIFPRKGSLEIGADADFTLINLNTMNKIEAEKLKSKGKFTPFDGMTFCASVEQTFIRGERVFVRQNK